MPTYHFEDPNFRRADAYSLNNPPQEPFRVRENFTPVQQQPTQHTYYAGQGTAAAMELKRKCEGLWLGWVAYKSGMAFYEMHPDPVEAALHGAAALRRWWIWLFWLKLWLLTLAGFAWLSYLKYHKIRGESFQDNGGGLDVIRTRILIFIIPATASLLIMWSRNIDFALFKRRWFYGIVRPLALMFEWCPNWILYVTIIMPVFFPWPMMGNIE